MLTRENDFEDRRIFTDEIDPDGRLHFITKFVKADDMVAMEGRWTSFFNFARKIMKTLGGCNGCPQSWQAPQGFRGAGQG